MSRRVWLLGCAAVLPGLVSAQSGENHYRCTNGDLVRRVQIFYETGAAVPCEVQYFKDTEAPGQREVLWRAINESGYCEARTREFLTDLESWGWQCTMTPPPGARTEPPRAGEDDTAVLDAAEPDE